MYEVDAEHVAVPAELAGRTHEQTSAAFFFCSCTIERGKSRAYRHGSFVCARRNRADVRTFLTGYKSNIWNRIRA